MSGDSGGILFGIRPLLLGIIFGLILAFGDTTYQGPAAAE